MDSLAFLDRADQATIHPVMVLHGDEPFLKRQVKTALRKLVLGADDSGFGIAVHDGETATFGAVMADVQTVAFLSAHRLVIVEDADPFVTEARARLEKYVGEPSASGILVLEVNTWPSNTRLAKLVPEVGTIVCKTPVVRALPRWCAAWSRRAYEKELNADASQLLVELVGPEMGQLDMELAKLASYAANARAITVADVDKLVGRGRTEEIWKIFEKIGNGQTAEALAHVDQLLELGEEPLRLLGAFSLKLRQLAKAARLTELGKSVSIALEEVGVIPFARRDAEALLRHLGRRRLDQVYDWLLRTDLGMKSTNHLPPRVLLERLVIQLARPTESAKRA